MNRWDHFDVIVTVGICATILGAGIFFFAFGGAPDGLLTQPPMDMAIDPQGVLQSSMGSTIVDAGRIRHLEETRLGPAQESLGEAIVGVSQVQQARGELVPGLRAEAHGSLLRMHGMIQETAGRSVVQAAERMWRQGNSETAQLEFIETLGRIRAGTILKERAAIPLREEALGWNVVGALLAMDRLAGQAQERLGTALRDAGVMVAMIDTGTSFTQESLGSAVLVAALSASQPIGASSDTTAATAVSAGLHEMPYQAGVIIFAALFVMAWGLRTVSESGTSLPTYGQSQSMGGKYRKTG